MFVLIMSIIYCGQNSILEKIPNRKDYKVWLRNGVGAGYRYLWGNLSLILWRTSLNCLYSNLFGLRFNFFDNFVFSWTWRSLLKNWWIWYNFFVCFPVRAISNLLLDLFDDVAYFSKGPELLHVMRSALYCISCFEKLGHSFKNFIKSEVNMVYYFLLCFDWRSSLKKSIKIT